MKTNIFFESVSMFVVKFILWFFKGDLLHKFKRNIILIQFMKKETNKQNN